MAQNKAQTIYLSSKQDFITLITTGTLTKNGITITYDPNVQYCVPEDENAFEVIDAPSSTTITDEIKELITTKIVIMKGTFAGYTNPLFIPSNSKTGDVCYGFAISNREMFSWGINDLTNAFTFKSKVFAINGLYTLNDKVFPSYPSSNDKFNFVYNNGTLAWELVRKTHNINVQASTASGTYNYQFQIRSLQTTQYAQLSEVGHYLFGNYPNTKIPASGVYTEGGDTYIITSVKASNVDNMVDVEMYKLSDGTQRVITSGVISVDDTIIN